MPSHKQTDLENKVQEKVSQYHNTAVDYDKMRYANKIMLRELVETWRRECEIHPEILQDDTLRGILEDVEKYAQMDVTSSHQGTLKEMGTYRKEKQERIDIKAAYREERKLFDSILEKVSAYSGELQTEAESDAIGHAEEEQVSRIHDMKYRMAINLEMYFESQRDGYLEPIPEGAKHIKETRVTYDSMEMRVYSEKDAPLFPHDPSATDISQGYLGNCYMVASFSGIAAKSPEKIKEMMKDNGDGTVTVRLYDRIPPVDQKEPKKDQDVYEPFYVTVKKEIPGMTGAQRCLWASVLERAMVVSGRFIPKKDKSDRRLIPPNIDELYETYKNMPEEERPTHEQCPWLFDSNDKLIPWEPSYKHIGQGGMPFLVVETILGEDAVGRMVDLEADGSAKEPDYATEFYKHLIEKKTSPEYLSKLEKYLRQEMPNLRPEKLWSIAATTIAGYKAPAGITEYPLPQFDRDGVPTNMPFSSVSLSYIEAVGDAAKQLMEERMEEEETLEGVFEEAWQNTDNLKIIIGGKPIFDGLDPEVRRIVSEAVQGETVIFNRAKTAYGEYEEGLYNQIEESLKNGALVNAGSIKDENDPTAGDKYSKNGIVYQHAYSVIGVTEEEHEGNTYKYVIVRNPHGSSRATAYDYSQVPPRPYETMDQEVEGIFKVELKHFMSAFDRVYYNEKKPLPKEPVTEKTISREMASRYKRILNDMEKNLDELLKETENPEDINREWYTFKQQVAHSAGTEFDVKRTFDTFDRMLESEKLKSEAGQKQMNRFRKTLSRTVDLMDQRIEHPKAHVLSELTGSSLYEKLSTAEVIAHQVKNEFGGGIENNKWEAQKALEMLEEADPFYISSSKQFKDLKVGLKILAESTKNYDPSKGGPAIVEYCNQLKDINRLATEYLTFKEDGVQKDRSANEKARMEVARSIQKYTREKEEGVKKEYLKVRMAEKVCNDYMTANGTMKEKQIMVRKIIKSDQFKTLTAGKTSDELADIFKDADKMKVFSAVYKDAVTNQAETKVSHPVKNRELKPNRELQHNQTPQTEAVNPHELSGLMIP